MTKTFYQPFTKVDREDDYAQPYEALERAIHYQASSATRLSIWSIGVKACYCDKELLQDLTMSDHFIFLMGKYEARVPKDRLYAPNHMWFRADGDAYRVGFTAFAVRLLQDVYFLDWNVEPGVVVAAKQEIGEIESSKAVSTLHAPLDGTLLRFNRELMKDPTAINVDNYGSGWLFDFDPKDGALLTAEDYIQRLEGGWDETQRQIKGQMND